MLKLSKREKLLLYIFFLVLIFSGAGIIYYFMIEKVIGLNENIALAEMQIQQLQKTMPDSISLKEKNEILQKEIEELQSKFYGDTEIDPYKFGILVRDLLSSKNLNISKYQTIETKEAFLLEFSVTGDALNFTEFLEQVSHTDKYWSINTLTINADNINGRVQAVFQITYETINKENI